MFKKSNWAQNIFLALIIFLIPTVSLAHRGDISEASSTPFQLLEIMEDHMMGEEQHERMEELMDQLLNGTLTATEQQEMIQLMQDAAAGPGAMTMIMRSMNQNTWSSSELDMMEFGMNTAAGWFTTILVWTALVLLIVLLIKKLTHKK